MMATPPETGMARDEEDTKVDLSFDIHSALSDHDFDDATYIVVQSGRSVGRMFRVASDRVMLIGRSPDAEILLDDEGVSRRHAQIEFRGGAPYLVDLDSTNGTWVESDRVGSEGHKLRDGDRIRVGPATILKYGYQDTVEQQFLAQLYRSATRDGLTGVHNKRWFIDQLDQEFAWHRRHNEPLTLILLDVDHFKRVNDTFGHTTGDLVLRELASLLTRTLRQEDTLARYGGEEFAVILRRTPLREGARLAERLRRRIEDHAFRHGQQRLPVTISLGVATGPASGLSTPEALVEAADQQLYRAKRAGRNRVMPSDPVTGAGPGSAPQP